jgi:hypothetical protein
VAAFVSESENLNFLAAWGDEFAESLSPVLGGKEVTPHDAYEVFVAAFRREPTPELLASLSEDPLEKLRVACETELEHSPIPIEAIRDAVARALARWPADGRQRPSPRSSQ